MSQEVPEGRISVEQLAAAKKNVVVEKKRGERRIVEQTNDVPNDVEIARAGKDQQYLTFVSKIRRLKVYIKPEEQIITADRRTHVLPAKFAQFENFIFRCPDEETEKFLLSCEDYGRRYWTNVEYVKMINAEKQKTLASESMHQKLLMRELAGEVEVARDRDLLAGLRPDADSLKPDAASVPNDGD